MGANGFDRMVDSQVACPGCRLAWLIIRHLIFNWQLTVAYGCLISGPSCLALPVSRVRASKSRLAESVVRADKARTFRNSRINCLSFGGYGGDKIIKRLNM